MVTDHEFNLPLFLERKTQSSPPVRVFTKPAFWNRALVYAVHLCVSCVNKTESILLNKPGRRETNKFLLQSEENGDEVFVGLRPHDNNINNNNNNNNSICDFCETTSDQFRLVTVQTPEETWWYRCELDHYLQTLLRAEQYLTFSTCFYSEKCNWISVHVVNVKRKNLKFDIIKSVIDLMKHETLY